MLRLTRALRSLACDPHNYFRELVTTNLRLRSRDPVDWLRLKSGVQRELAQRRTGTPTIPIRRLEQVLPAATRVNVNLLPIVPQPYNVSWYELVVIVALARALQPKTVFEFGTFDGRTTVHLALNTPPQCRVVTLDIAAGPFAFGCDDAFCDPITVGHWLRGVESPVAREAVRKITCLTGDSRSFDFSAHRAAIDLIFIDADHDESAVLHDSRAAFDMLRPGGMILWHDYLMLEGVTRALRVIADERHIVHIEGTTLAVFYDGKSPGAP